MYVYMFLVTVFVIKIILIQRKDIKVQTNSIKNQLFGCVILRNPHEISQFFQIC